MHTDDRKNKMMTKNKNEMMKTNKNNTNMKTKKKKVGGCDCEED